MTTDEKRQPPPRLIGVVGPCAAGKSTLIQHLTARGYNARHIAQEHSYVPDMWQRLTAPQVLIFLDVSYPVACARRKLDWTEEDWREQQRRLRHARQHADLYVDTDRLDIQDVLQTVLGFLEVSFLPPSGSETSANQNLPRIPHQ
jgi:cytidylate kinase